MKPICMNCRYIGAVRDRDDLVCSQTKNFESVKLDGNCERYTQDVCERCECEDLSFYSFSPDDKPYVIRTEYTCNSCGSFWYLDI